MRVHNEPGHEIARSEISNWRVEQGDLPEDVPPDNLGRLLTIKEGTGCGGVSIFSAEKFGDAEIHVELDDLGLHLLVYVPGSDEPVINAFLRENGVVVEDIKEVKD